MAKDSKLAAEVLRWKRKHNESPEMRAKREEESRKRAERRDAESIGRKHVAFRSEHAETVDDILSFMDVDFGDDSAENAQRLYEYLAEGRFRLVRREEIAFTEQQNFAHVGTVVRDAQAAPDRKGFWGVKGEGFKARSPKLDKSVKDVDRLTTVLETYDSYLPPMAKPEHGPCKQIPPERWDELSARTRRIQKKMADFCDFLGCVQHRNRFSLVGCRGKQTETRHDDIRA